MIKKEAEKNLKYKDILEIQYIWNVIAKVKPVTIGVEPTQTKPEQHTGRARSKGTTKNSHPGPAHVLWKVLM
jgi:hypothetical protein